MQGVIKTRDVLSNLPLIYREFGLRCATRAVLACARHGHTTFLDVAFDSAHAAAHGPDCARRPALKR